MQSIGNLYKPIGNLYPILESGNNSIPPPPPSPLHKMPHCHKLIHHKPHQLEVSLPFQKLEIIQQKILLHNPPQQKKFHPHFHQLKICLPFQKV